MRSAAGLATTPYLPCIMLGMRAWPTNGDGVTPSASNAGQVTILPVIPSVPKEPGALPFDVSIPCSGSFVIGQASRPLRGSMVPAKLFESGWLNMSCVNCPVASPVPPASSKRVISKPLRPGSLTVFTAPGIPPPASCSPLSGKSSSKMNTDTFAGGNGVGWVRIVYGVVG